MRKPWDQYFLEIASLVAERATCPRRHVGCVLVREKHLIATGYNGSVQGQPHCTEVGCLVDATGSCRRTIHAEKNALLQAAAQGIAVAGSTAYITDTPCRDCAMALVQAGVIAVQIGRPYRRGGLEVLEVAGIPVTIPPDPPGPDLLGLVGLAGSGKDTLAHLLDTHYGYRPIAMADPLHHLFHTVLPGMKPRKAYQEVGDIVRREQPKAFVDVVARAVAEGGRWVVTDIRQMNEADFILESGGILLGITCPDALRYTRLQARDGGDPPIASTHTTEQLTPLWAHCTLSYANTGTLADMEQWVQELGARWATTCATERNLPHASSLNPS